MTNFRICLSNNRKKPFQPFAQKGQYYKYRKTLIIVECLIIRSLHDKICGHRDAIPIKHSTETNQAGFTLYKYYLTSRGHPDPMELTIKKHNLFVAILQAGEESEDKVACPLDQAILASSLMASGKWQKASLVRSLVTTAIWSLSAIDAHWCRLATTGVQPEEYTSLLSPADSNLTADGLAEIEPPNNPDNVDKNVLLDDETDEDEEDDKLEASGDELADGLNKVDMAKINKALQQILNALEMADCPEPNCQPAKPFNSSSIKQ